VRQRRTRSGLAWVGVAAATLLLGHWAAYVLAYRQIRLRDIVLAQTGHSYLAPLGKLAFVLLFLGMAWLSTEACMRRSGRSERPVRFLSAGARLIAIQIVGFSALEIVERLVVHAPVMQMFGHYTFVLGLVMQVITGLVGAVVVLLFARTVRQIYLSIVTRRVSPRRAGAVGRCFTGQSFALRRGLVGSIGVRGPPLPSGF
jgi:hypothetical protein